MNISLLVRRKPGPLELLFCLLRCNPHPHHWHTCKHTLVCCAITCMHKSVFLHTHTLSHPHTLTNKQYICNFKGWIEDPVASITVQGRAYSISPGQFLTLTYRRCITFQYCTEACRQRTADTSKGCGKSTFLLGASQLCHSCSEVGQRGTGRGQAWLKTSAAILKNGFSISHFDELKLSGLPVGRAWWFPGPAQLILRVKQRDDLDHKMCVTGQIRWMNIK